MRVLFLSLLDFKTFGEQNIYADLLREFIKNGHDVYCISPVERRTGMKTHFAEHGHLLKLKIGNIQKTNIFEKGISTLMIERQFISAIKKYFSKVKFDLILYSTPPITFANVIKFVKKRDGAESYLMLKDIFPQNAVDLGMMSKTGIKGFIYRYFRSKEKRLYSYSDRIGCMSRANVNYLLEHNSDLSHDRVEVCPNCIETYNMRLSDEERKEMRRKYGLPESKKLFVYGGNLGKPQDVPFIIKCLQKCAEINDAYFVIAGSGTDRHLLERYLQEKRPAHVKLFEQLPKDEYDRMIACCDVGLIFLDHRFTIPNFPSRLLSYMQAGLPVLACTDAVTDIKETVVEGGFGVWCESNDADGFVNAVKSSCFENANLMGDLAEKYLKEHYDVSDAYKKITSFCQSATRAS